MRVAPTARPATSIRRVQCNAEGDDVEVQRMQPPSVDELAWWGWIDGRHRRRARSRRAPRDSDLWRALRALLARGADSAVPAEDRHRDRARHRPRRQFRGETAGERSGQSTLLLPDGQRVRRRRPADGGFFAPWPADKVPNLAAAHPKANPANQGVTVMFSPIGIAYRRDLVKTRPRSWKDLWDNPDIKGKVGLYEITNTAGFMFLMMTAKIFGSGPMDFDAGFREIERLKPFPQAGLAGALAVLLSRGEVVAGPLDYGETLGMQKKGLPMAWAAPSEGMFMFDQTFSLLKNGPNKDAACAFLDHMLSEDIQAKLALEFAGIPVNRNVKLPPDQVSLTADDLDKIVAFDWVAANKVRDSVIERWNRMTRG